MGKNPISTCKNFPVLPHKPNSTSKYQSWRNCMQKQAAEIKVLLMLLKKRLISESFSKSSKYFQWSKKVHSNKKVDWNYFSFTQKEKLSPFLSIEVDMQLKTLWSLSFIGKLNLLIGHYHLSCIYRLCLRFWWSILIDMLHSVVTVGDTTCVYSISLKWPWQMSEC